MRLLPCTLLTAFVCVLAGCVTHRDATNDRAVRQAGIVGRQFELVSDLPLAPVSPESYVDGGGGGGAYLWVKSEGPSRRVGPDGTVYVNEPRPPRTATKGTRLRISRVTWNQYLPEYECYYFYAVLIDGPYAGTEAAVEHMFYGFLDDPQHPMTPNPQFLRPVTE